MLGAGTAGLSGARPCDFLAHKRGTQLSKLFPAPRPRSRQAAGLGVRPGPSEVRAHPHRYELSCGKGRAAGALGLTWLRPPPAGASRTAAARAGTARSLPSAPGFAGGCPRWSGSGTCGRWHHQTLRRERRAAVSGCGLPWPPSPAWMEPSPPVLLTVYPQGIRTLKPMPTKGLSLNAPALRHAVLSSQTLVIKSSRQGKRKEESLPWRVISSQYAEPKNGMLTCREVPLADTPVTIRAGEGGDRGPSGHSQKWQEYPQRKQFTRFQ